MASTSPTISVPLPTLTIRVRLPRMYRLRMWAVTTLIGIAARIGPHNIVVEIEGDDQRLGHAGGPKPGY